MTKDSLLHTGDDPLPHYIATEVNLARLPFFASSTQSLSSKKQLTYRFSTQQDGRDIEAVWEITANAKYGYPGPQAEAVHAAILDIVSERGLPARNPITFTFYDLCKRLDITYNGTNVQKLRDAIMATRLAGITMHRAFATRTGERLTFTDTQHLYQRAIFAGREEFGGASADVSAVWLADFYLESLNSGYVRPIDFRYFKNLYRRSYAATKLYQYLGYRFAGAFKHGNPYAKVGYEDLAAILDIKPQRYLSKAQERLQQAHTALADTGFLKRVTWIPQPDSRRSGAERFLLHYYPGPRARHEYQTGRRQLSRLARPSVRANATKKANNPSKGRGEGAENGHTKQSYHELAALGVTQRRARHLAHQYAPHRISKQINHLAFLSERGRSPENPPAWLVRAIEEDYALPRGLKQRAQRKEEEKRRADQAQQRQRARKRERQAERRERLRRARLDEALGALSAADQETIQRSVTQHMRSELGPVLQQMYKKRTFDPKSPLYASMYYRLLESHLESHHQDATSPSTAPDVEGDETHRGT